MARYQRVPSTGLFTLRVLWPATLTPPLRKGVFSRSTILTSFFFSRLNYLKVARATLSTTVLLSLPVFLITAIFLPRPSRMLSPVIGP